MAKVKNYTNLIFGYLASNYYEFLSNDIKILSLPRNGKNMICCELVTPRRQRVKLL